MKATLKNYRQSPRKVRLVANLVKGKKVEGALAELAFLPKRAALPIEKLLKTAIANAKNAGNEVENLVVKNVTVDKGVTLKRIMPRARGSASRINKRSSHVTLVLGEKTAAKNKTKKVTKK
jgi:large subunit ribosomal protein L22